MPSRTGEYTFEPLIADRLPMMINCSVHPAMSAVVRVFEHGYFALTDVDGAFVIKDAPIGTFRIFIWHEAIGYLDGKRGSTGKVIPLTRKITDLGTLSLSP